MARNGTDNRQRRNTFYVHDNDEWNKDEDLKDTKKAIFHISQENLKQCMAWSNYIPDNVEHDQVRNRIPSGHRREKIVTNQECLLQHKYRLQCVKINEADRLLGVRPRRDCDLKNVGSI